MKKSVLIILIVLIIVLISGLLGFAYLILNKEELNTEENQENLQTEQFEYYRASIDDLILNITNARGRIKLMKLSLSLKSNDTQIENIIENNKAEFIDRIIKLISARTSDELLTLGGKTLLKEELKTSFNNIINNLSAKDDEVIQNSIKNIFFTDFVIK